WTSRCRSRVSRFIWFTTPTTERLRPERGATSLRPRLRRAWPSRRGGPGPASTEKRRHGRMTRASRKYRERLSHIDPESGKIRMVDVSAKPETAREAVARGHIAIAAGALRQIRAGALK